MARFDVTTIGEGQLRFSVPVGERLERATCFDVHVAGTEANVTGLLSRLGWRCGWVSSLPQTPLGQRVCNEYRLSGLNLEAVTWSNTHRLATYYVEYASPPRSTQVYFDRADTCFTHLKPADINWDYLLDTKLLHLSGLSVPLSSSVRDIIFEALRRAKAAGVQVSFDLNYRRRLWAPEEAARSLAPLVRQCDLLFCGRADAATVFGIRGNAREIVKQLAALTDAQHIVTSLGSEGLIGWDGHRSEIVVAPKVQVLDRIGAGDAMVAGVLHGYLAGDFKKGLGYGVLTAALALTQYGDQVMTNAAELESLYANPQGEIDR